MVAAPTTAFIIPPDFEQHAAQAVSEEEGPHASDTSSGAGHHRPIADIEKCTRCLRDDILPIDGGTSRSGTHIPMQQEREDEGTRDNRSTRAPGNPIPPPNHL